MEKQIPLFGGSTIAVAKPKSPAPAVVKHAINIFIDGAARGNPGPAGAGIHGVYDGKVVLAQGIYLGEKTNNQAEYLALLLALLFIEKLFEDKKLSKAPLHFFSDSELLVKQMNGIYKMKNEHLKALKVGIDHLLKSHPHKFTHVRREKNKDADALANLGVDSRKKIPTRFEKFLSDYGLHF